MDLDPAAVREFGEHKAEPQDGLPVLIRRQSTERPHKIRLLLVHDSRVAVSAVPARQAINRLALRHGERHLLALRREPDRDNPRRVAVLDHPPHEGHETHIVALDPEDPGGDSHGVGDLLGFAG